MPETITTKERIGQWLASLLVWPMRVVTPLAAISCPLLLSTHDLARFSPSLAGSWVHYALAAYSVADLLFYVWFRKTLRAAQKLTSPPIVRLDVHKRVWKAITDSALPGEGPFEFLSTWFPVPTRRVGRHDMRNCLAVGFFGTPLHRLRPGCEELTEVERMLTLVEQQQGFQFPSGEKHLSWYCIALYYSYVSSQISILSSFYWQQRVQQICHDCICYLWILFLRYTALCSLICWLDFLIPVLTYLFNHVASRGIVWAA